MTLAGRKPPQASEQVPDASAANVIELQDAETAKQFECLRTYDHKIHIPGVWSGMFSAIPVHAAEKLIEQGHQGLRKKGTA